MVAFYDLFLSSFFNDPKTTVKYNYLNSQIDSIHIYFHFQVPRNNIIFFLLTSAISLKFYFVVNIDTNYINVVILACIEPVIFGCQPFDDMFFWLHVIIMHVNNNNTYCKKILAVLRELSDLKKSLEREFPFVMTDAFMNRK